MKAFQIALIGLAVLSFSACKDDNSSSSNSTPSDSTGTTPPDSTPPETSSPSDSTSGVASGATSSAYTPPATPFVPAGFTIEPELSKERKTSFTDAPYVLEDNKDYQAIVETDKGRMVLELFEDETPVTVNNFVFLARNHFYDGIIFHRTIADFMVQTGDPQGTGSGGPGYQFNDEFRQKLTFDQGLLLAMANAGPGTNGSQFFITYANSLPSHLNGKHTIFGKLIEGEAVLNAIEKGEPPANPSKMQKVYIVSKPK
jgi:cyclophilin family peptidyl-prolyl cis-trans isomerase